TFPPFHSHPAFRIASAEGIGTPSKLQYPSSQHTHRGIQGFETIPTGPALRAVLLQKERYTMKKNVGGIDKGIRILVGVVLIAWALAGGPVWAWIGILPLFTGLVGWCPAYLPFGLRTCKSCDNGSCSSEK